MRWMAVAALGMSIIGVACSDEAAGRAAGDTRDAGSDSAASATETAADSDPAETIADTAPLAETRADTAPLAEAETRAETTAEPEVTSDTIDAPETIASVELADADPDGSWRWANPLPSGRSLTAVWASSPRNVWGVGPAGLLVHYDGDAWQTLDASLLGLPGDLDFVGGAGDAFAVVCAWSDCRVWRGGDLDAWEVLALPADFTADLFQVWIAEPYGVWILGHTSADYHGAAALWNGHSWQVHDLEAKLGLAMHNASAVTGLAADDVSVLGAGGEVAHLLHGAWSLTAHPAFESYERPARLLATPEATWLVSDFARVYTLSGSHWLTGARATVDGDPAAWLLLDGHPTYLTDACELLAYDGAWQPLTTPAFTCKHGATVGDRLWAFDDVGAVAERTSDGSWRALRTPTGFDDDVSALRGEPSGAKRGEPSGAKRGETSGASERVWTVYGPHVRSFDGAQWDTLTPPAHDYTDLWTDGHGALWLTTSDGLVVHWDGASWSETKVAATLFAIHGTAADRLWAIGFTDPSTSMVDDSAYAWDGDAWTEHRLAQPDPSSGFEWPMVAAKTIQVTANEVWVGGCDASWCERPMLARWTGSAWEFTADVANQVQAAPDGTVWAWTSAGLARRVDGDWVPLATPLDTPLQLLDWQVVANDDVWVLGAPDSGRPAVVHWDGHAWSRLAAPPLPDQRYRHPHLVATATGRVTIASGNQVVYRLAPTP